VIESVEAAVVVLEQCDLRALLEDPAAMAEAMIERQHALDYLKSHPLSAVREEERVEFCHRLHLVSQRDAEAMQLLGEAKAHIGEQLGKLVSGRALARGYGGLSAEGSSQGSGAKRTG
jgi:hypothetical protein